MIGKVLSSVLEEIEDSIFEYEVNYSDKPEYTQEGFRAAIKIFMSALMDKMWELQENDNISQEDRENMATRAGEDLRKLIKTYTNIDTHSLYK